MKLSGPPSYDTKNQLPPPTTININVPEYSVPSMPNVANPLEGRTIPSNPLGLGAPNMQANLPGNGNPRQ